jgi:hypothetical protein
MKDKPKKRTVDDRAALRRAVKRKDKVTVVRTIKPTQSRTSGRGR